MYTKGFDQDNFFRWYEKEFDVNRLVINLVLNIINYAQEHEHVSKDQFCYFVSDMLDIDFLDVAKFCEDCILTRDTLRNLGRLKKSRFEMNDFDRLKELIGKKMDYDDVICAMIDEDMDIIVKESENGGYNYIAYYNTEDSKQYLFHVDENDVITDVREFEY